MNVLLFDDLFITICLFLNMKQIIRLELLSTDHHLLIRKTTWYRKVLVYNEIILNHIVKNYRFKNLSLSRKINVNLYIDYLKNCHTLDLNGTNITDENVKELKNCYDLDLSYTKITDVTALTNCYHLNLQGTTITNLPVFTNCHELNLKSTYITDESIKLLNCYHLNLSNTNITNKSINQLKNYDVLNLSYTNITKVGFKMLNQSHYRIISNDARKRRLYKKRND